MVTSKKFHCVVCNKKCSGNVIRYQDQYYHKQCFELEQSTGKTPELYADSAPSDSDYPLDDSHSQTPILNYDNNDHHRHSSSTTARSTPTNQQTPIGSSSSTRLPFSTLNSDRSQSKRAASKMSNASHQERSKTIDNRVKTNGQATGPQNRSATLPHSLSSPNNGFINATSKLADCASCGQKIKEGQALIALDLHWHVWCFKCSQCQVALHGEYVAKEGKAYCEKDYQKLFGVMCVYCKRYITGKVLQAGETHHFHPSCARCSKCGDPFIPGEEMYLQGEVTWHPRCGPGPDSIPIMDELALDSSNRSHLRARSPSLSSRSRSRSASPFSLMSRQYGRTSPYADSEAVGDLSRIYTISYLNADPNQGYLRRPVDINPPKSPQFSRPTSTIRDRSRSSSRSQGYNARDRSVPRGMYSVLSSMRSGSGSSNRARSPSMMNEEAIHLAQYPSGQKPSPDVVPKIERDDFPAPPFPYLGSSVGSKEAPVEQNRVRQQRSSRPRSREVTVDNDDSSSEDLQLRKEQDELSKIANGIGKIFLQTLKEREKLRAWKKTNLDPRNASRTPSATRELPSRLRYENPTNASPSRDMHRPRPWEDDDFDHSPTRTKSSLGRPSQMSSSSYGYKVVQSNRSTPKPGYGLSNGPYEGPHNGISNSEMSFQQQQQATQNRSSDLLSRAAPLPDLAKSRAFSTLHIGRSMPNVNINHIHQEGPPKLYPYHLLATSNYRLPPDIDRCHLERHLSNEEFHYIFHCDRLDFYRLPEWKRNELKRRAKLF